MRFVILHYHILKNAGSTVEEILDRSFGERFHRYDTPERGGIITADEVLAFIDANPRLEAFSSHQIRYPLPHSRDILFFDICFLRDPLDRIRSMYDYFRKRPAPGDPISDLAEQTTLGDFIAGMVADHPLHVTNAQVNLLAQAGNSDEPDRNDLALARERFLKASFPGVVDLFDESAVAGEYFLRAAFPALDCALPPVNVSKGLDSTLAGRIEQLRSVCDPEVFGKLLELNALDFQLLDCARAEVMRRFHLVPDHIAKLDELRRRVSTGAAVPHAPEAPPPASGPVAQARRRVTSVFDRSRGTSDGLDIRPLFDAAFYLDRNPDVRAARIDPLQHYLAHGAAEGRKPHPLFDPAFYLAGVPAGSLAEAAANPLLHFLRHNAANPHPLFDGSAASLLDYIGSKESR